ncbi:MAG: hypothetical protein MJZ23_05470 [Paludibacteraceae bacterium]|nr:hypothetical protein [Paludibacteraceae bacterium]
MYPEEIQTLIKSIVADGKYTVGEQSVLHEKAKQFGIDCNELDVYVQNLIRMLIQRAEAKAEEQRQSLIKGNVKKCPNCGTIVSADLDKCPECSCELTNVAAPTALQRFSYAIENLPVFKNGIRREFRAAFIIIEFPIPSTKEELLEFIQAMDLGRKSEEHETLKKTYDSKYKECVLKAKTLFPNDEDIISLPATTEKTEPLSIGCKVMDSGKKIFSKVKTIAVTIKYLFS